MTLRNDFTAEGRHSVSVVSRHVTSEGVLVYYRTGDGRLRFTLHPWSTADRSYPGPDTSAARIA